MGQVKPLFQSAQDAHERFDEEPSAPGPSVAPRPSPVSQSPQAAEQVSADWARAAAMNYIRQLRIHAR